MEWVTKTADTVEVSIVMAGDLDDAKRICRKFCFEEDLCVTVEPTTYVYTGGQEEGVRVGLINYPRFPKNEIFLMNQARLLARTLAEGLFQNSYSVIGPTTTEWFTRRKEDQK